MSEKIFKKLAASILLLLLAPVLTLLGINGCIKALKDQLAQAQQQNERWEQAHDFMRNEAQKHASTIVKLREENAQARALLEEVVDVTSVRFSEFGEQMPHSETAVHEAQRAARLANLMRAIRAFLAQSKAEGEA